MIGDLRAKVEEIVRDVFDLTELSLYDFERKRRRRREEEIEIDQVEKR